MRTTVCLTARVFGGPETPKTKHYLGLPPETVGGKDNRLEMPAASVLIIEVKNDGIFLTRFAPTGQFAGDTWHRSIEEAKEQAESEYGGYIFEWREVPPEIDDPIPFALRQ